MTVTKKPKDRLRRKKERIAISSRDLLAGCEIIVFAADLIVSGGWDYEWKVRLRVRQQSFEFAYSAPDKESAEWYADQVRIALNRIVSANAKVTHADETR